MLLRCVGRLYLSSLLQQCVVSHHLLHLVVRVLLVVDRAFDVLLYLLLCCAQSLMLLMEVSLAFV